VPFQGNGLPTTISATSSTSTFGTFGQYSLGFSAAVAGTEHALAYVVIANRRHTDLFEWGQRTTPFSLAAEIQRRLLPTSYTCEAGQFTLAGWLEPASTVGGDTFDYNLDREMLHLSITDAVGHEVEAALRLPAERSKADFRLTLPGREPCAVERMANGNQFFETLFSTG